VLVALALGPVGTATAGPPTVTITSPLDGSVSSSQTPSFSGLAEEGGGAVTLRIYEGPTANGAAVQEFSTLLPFLGGAWAVGPAEQLADGTYTAQATQNNLATETGTSSPVSFTVDTAAPTVTLNSPNSPSQDTKPSFSGTASDATAVTVQIHAGATTKGAVVSKATATGTGGGWSSGTASPVLSTGQFTAVAVQSSSLPGNPAGRSDPVTFVVTPIVPAVAIPPAPPLASFKWIPFSPHTDEPVTLVSTSAGGSSPIAGFAWAPVGNGMFTQGESAITTSFSTPGAHIVQLRVTDEDGLSSTVPETIVVTSPAPTLMQPFPVVRIVGSDSSSGARISLLTVLASVGARVRVTCHGGGCSTKSQQLVVASPAKSRAGTVLINFHRFERSLRAGAVLHVWVSNYRQIGKFTRFVIRRGGLPGRTDLCLDPAGTKPIVCPSS
jgi:hypothetical protein